MAGKRTSGNPVPVADLAGEILDPVLRKRAGLSVALVQSWDEIVGPRIAQSSRPEKIQWGRRRDESDPYEPAVLVIACEGLAALHIQHEAGEIVNRVNAFMGYMAIGRLRIVQKPVRQPKPERPRLRELGADERERLKGIVSGIEDEGLRQSLERLGASVRASRKR
ncbi:MAG: DciA family protein [Rhizobiaceae bacterium]|nr:DciA family protein [Rhizobiaceae bacterium]